MPEQQILPDWDRLINNSLETAGHFRRGDFVISEMAVRFVVLETLKIHGLKGNVKLVKHAPIKKKGSGLWE